MAVIKLVSREFCAGEILAFLETLASRLQKLVYNYY